MKRQDSTWTADLSAYLLADKRQNVYDYRYVEEKTGISHDWIFRIWNGRADPRGSHLVKIARFLGYTGSDVEVQAYLFADVARWKRDSDKRRKDAAQSSADRGPVRSGSAAVQSKK